MPQINSYQLFRAVSIVSDELTNEKDLESSFQEITKRLSDIDISNVEYINTLAEID
mgnify:CR=1 FL=1